MANAVDSNFTDSANSVSSRLNWMDALKLFTIFLVLWGDCVQHLVSTHYYEEPVYRFIYSFHMPLFMTISGFFAANIAKRSFWDALFRKFRQLILPAISFGIIVFIMFALYRWEFHPKSLPRQIFFNYWFLKSAFLCSVGYLVVSKLGEKNKYIFASLIVLSLLGSQFVHYFSFERMYPCFLLGVFVKKYWSWIKLNEKTLLIISGIIFFAMSLFWGEEFWLYSNASSVFVEKMSDMFPVWLIKRFLYAYRLLIGFAGTLFLIFSFDWLSAKIPSNKFNDFICKNGQYTLGIYILQCTVLETVMARFVNFDDSSFFVFNFVWCPIISLLVLILCIAIIKMIKLSKILNYFLLGEKK